ncbi:hypothetical protein [Anabaena subtropica]|uniref:hypothetical protein n=1 Tax=Anabaena subtropica TaxID=425380 RepID=UPI001F55A1F6|nr:hypothetical protein [Anabaena subtropica]
MSRSPSHKRNKAVSAASSNLQRPVNPGDPASVTIDVSAVEVPELSEEEERDRLHLERKVERAFFEARKALSACLPSVSRCG